MRYLAGIFFLIFAFQTACFSMDTKKNVLMLHSYHQGLTWTDSLTDGIKAEILKSNPQTNFFIEYIDLKRLAGLNRKKEFYTFLSEKYQSFQFKCIILSDNDALDFWSEYGELIAPSVPVVFCGINNLPRVKSNYTGILEDINIKDNIKLIQTLHKDLKKLYIVTDITTTGELLKNEVDNLLKYHQFNIKYEILQKLDYQSLKKKVSNLYKGDVLLFLLFNKDTTGRFFNYEEVLDSISYNCSVPIYGTWSFYLNHGIVGGLLMDGTTHGQEAGRMASKILNGTPLSQLPIENGRSKYIFDYNKTQKYHLNQNQFPENALLLNAPASLIRNNPAFLNFIFIFLSILIIVIIILIINNIYKNKKMVADLKHLEEMKIQQQLLKEAKEKAEEASLLKTTFLANVSHEIRTPMNGIVGFINLLNNKKDMTDEERSVFTEMINQNSKILLNLINDIMDISRIEANQLPLRESKTNIIKLLKELYSLFSNQQEEDSLRNTNRLIIDVPIGSQELYMLVDEDRLRQVFVNLIGNAIKFTENGVIQFGYKFSQNFITFFVRDNGIGIDVKQIEFIFDRFRQVDDSNTRKFGGTGLGLAISKAIVEKMNGRIWVESIINKGSVFYFSIPIDKKLPITEVETVVEKLSEENIIWSDKKLLVATANNDYFSSIETITAPTRIKITRTLQSKSTIELGLTESFDCIILDMNMAGIETFKVAKDIRNHNKLLPIIGLIFDSQLDEEYCYKSGCSHILQKPITPTELITVMKKALLYNFETTF